MVGKKEIISLWAFGSVLFLVMMSNGKTVHGITCQEALSTLNPCAPYLVGDDPLPSAICCSAVTTVNQQATTKEIRQMLCQCFKQSPALGVKPEKAKKIPDLCHVQFVVPIDPNVDCTTIP